MRNFESVDEVMAAVKKIRDGLQSVGEEETAVVLNESLNVFYTTATEALGELRRVLEETEQIWSKNLSQGYRELGKHTIKEATRLIKLT